MKSSKNRSKKPSFSGQGHPKLTKTQAEVLHLLTADFLTPKQISISRKTTLTATYFIIKKLREKGVINKAYKNIENIECALEVNRSFHKIRLHGQEFNIKILFKDFRYLDLLKKSNILFIDGSTVRLYKNSVEIYANKSFYGDDVQRATAESLRYWQRFFIKLENQFKIILVKSGKQNITLVKHHYAEINNELARDLNISADKIRIYAKEDGLLWFVIDNSFNLHEAETTHRHTAKKDMEKVKEIFQDIRDNNPPTLSEIMVLIKEVVDVNKETASGLNSVVTLFKNQFPEKINDSQDLNIIPDYVG